MAWDSEFLLFIQEHLRFDFLTPIMKLITHMGDSGILWIVLTLVLLIIPKTRKIGIVAAAALVVEALLVNGIIKHAVDRPRPYTQIDGLILLIEKQKDASFPSGHSGSSFVCAVAYVLCAFGGINETAKKKWFKVSSICALLLAFLIAWSRLYVGVHYPTDVITGVVIGTLVAVISFIVFKKIFNRNTREGVEQ